MIWNSAALVEVEPNGLKQCKGNVTDAGLLNYFLNAKIDVLDYLDQKSENGFIQIKLPFNSRRKRMTTAVKISGDKYRVFVKGGPEIVLDFCKHKMIANG